MNQIKIIVLLFFGLCYNSFAYTLNEYPFIMADKQNGTLSIYYSKTKIKTTVALFGSKIGDNFEPNVYNDYNMQFNHITPSGIFITEKLYSAKLNKPILAFVKGFDKILAIHPIWMNNPNKDRVNRLLSKSSSDNRITNGCIGVEPEFFNNELYNLPIGTKLVILSEK